MAAKKLVTVTKLRTCNGCRFGYLAHSDEKGTYEQCSKADKTIKNYEYFEHPVHITGKVLEIPDWCPLEDWVDA